MRRYTASNVILILIGNKCDMEELREVEFAEAEALCQYMHGTGMHASLCMETSAKDNKNITEAFMNLATELKVRKGRRDVYWIYLIKMHFHLYSGGRITYRPTRRAREESNWDRASLSTTVQRPIAIFCDY